MSLYSFNGAEPTPLPKRILLSENQTESGLPETRTSLDELSVEELNSYGFTGPYTVPDHDSIRQYVTWDSENLEYIVNDYSESEIEANLLVKKREDLNPQKFVLEVTSSEVYKEIRYQASQDLLKNTLATEFLSILSELNNNPEQCSQISQVIQQKLLAIFKVFSLTLENIQEISTILSNSSLDLFVTLPDPTFLENFVYDVKSDSLVPSQDVDTSGYDGPPPPEA